VQLGGNIFVTENNRYFPAIPILFDPRSPCFGRSTHDRRRIREQALPGRPWRDPSAQPGQMIPWCYRLG
jgi:hypothetical protein